MNISQVLAEFMLQTQNLKAQQIEATDTISRLMTFAGSIYPYIKSWEIWTRDLSGTTTMIWDNPAYDIWGTAKWGTTGSYANALTLQASGGIY